MTRIAAMFRKALEFPSQRPVVTLLITGGLVVLALFGVLRIHADSSLETMFAKNDPAADSLVRVLNQFGAVEELLVLVTVPDGPSIPAGPQPGQLTEFAKRFESAIKSSPDAPQLVSAVMYRADEDTQRFFRDVLVPAGMFYLDNASLEEARQRLTREGMARQMSRNEALLSQPGPAAAAAAKLVKFDPLRLNEFLKSRFAGIASSFGSFDSAGGESPALISPDGRALLIRVIGKRPPSDLEFCKRLVAAAEKAGTSANIDHLNVSLGGAYAIATTSERALRADSTSSVLSAFASLIVLFALVFRRPIRLVFLAIFPLALGSLLGFGAYALIDRSMTILSAVVGAMMVGMGIDYSIHFLTHYEKLRAAGRSPREAAAETSRSLFGVLFAAWITSVMGFAVVGFSAVPALGTFALLGSLGLAGVYLTSLTVVPALLVLTDKGGASANRARLRFSVEPLLAWITRHARTCITCSLLVFVASLCIGLGMPGPILPLEPDLSVMHPRPNAALQTQVEIAKRFGSVPDAMMIHMKADSPEHLVSLAHRVDEHLRQPAPRAAGIVGTIGLATFLPDPQVAEQRIKSIDQVNPDRVVADFESVVADSAFEPSQFAGYTTFLRSLLQHRTAPTLVDLLRYPALARTMLPSKALNPGANLPTEAVTLVSLRGSIDERDRRAAVVESVRTALADVPGATLTGMAVLGHDVEARVQRDVLKLLGISVALVLVYVLVHFRSIRDGILSLSTAIFGMVVLLAVMRLAHVKVNMINLIALPLLIGMTVDYGIFLVSLARLGRESGNSPEHVRQHVASSAQAVVVCAGATLIGFGSLIWVSLPAIRSLGIVVAVGMMAALFSAFFLLAPILLMNSSQQKSSRVDGEVDAAANSQQRS